MITLQDIASRQLLDRLNDLFGTAPKIQFYAGQRPAYPTNVINGATLLAEVQFTKRAFQNAHSEGGAAVLYLDEPPPPAKVINTGVANFFRAIGIDQGVEGTGQPIMDGDVSDGNGNGDCKLLDTSLIAGQEVNVLSWQIYLPQ